MGGSDHLLGEHRVPGCKFGANPLCLGKIPGEEKYIGFGERNLWDSIFDRSSQLYTIVVFGRIDPPYIQGVGCCCL